MKRHNYPTRKELINTFLELENKGKLNWNFIYDENMHLYNAARILFGSLQKAVEAAGLDYNQCLSHQKWSKEKIIRELKELHKKNVRLSSNVLRKINPALEGVIESKRYFNSQQEARKAAGIPEDEYKREKWSKEKIIIELKNLHRKNIYMSADNIIKLNPNLSSAIKGKRYFKSLKEARKAAGINFVVISQRKWTDEKIINEIKKLHKKGIRITSKEIKPINAGLVSVIEKYMKSWESARKAAGVSLKKKQ
jgi:soluble P-type ATPase